MTFSIGENVGAYRIVEQLGQGGMATVFKAYHAALDRYVAIKVMHAAFKEDPTFLARFQREARVVAKLEHPNIVPVYDYAEHNGSPYLVMKFIEGETLKARLARGRMTIPEIRWVVEGVGAGLDYAHRQGILHRDIKPSNVMLARDGGLYLADFGLARIAMAGESTLSSDTMLGTPHYMSPEQAKGVKNLDGGTDIYSFGVVVYELTVGRVPYNADTPFAIIHDHIFTPLPMPRAVNPAVTEEVERVLLKALAKERADRYPDAAAFVRAFLEATASQAGEGLPAGAAEVTRVGAAGGATAVAAGAAALAQPQANGGASPTVIAPSSTSRASAAAGATVIAPVTGGSRPSGATQLSAPAATRAAGHGRPFPWVWVGVAAVAVILLGGMALAGLGLLRVATQKAHAASTATAVAAVIPTTVVPTVSVVPTGPVVPMGGGDTPVPPSASAPTQALPPGVLYLINFDDGQAPGWKLDSAWKVTNGALCGTDHGFAGLDQSHGGMSWGDYREAFILTLQAGNLNASFRQQVGTPQARYVVSFTPGGVSLSKQTGSQVTNALQTWKGAVALNTPHGVEIMGQGPRMVVTLDKTTAIDFTDPQAIPQGGISFESAPKSSVCVDMVEVDQIGALPPPAGSPAAPAGADLGALFDGAGQAFDAQVPDKGFALLDEAVKQDPQNTAVLLRAGDTALAHGAQYARQALTLYYMPAVKIERSQKDDLNAQVTGHTTLAMYAMAQDPDGGKLFDTMAQTWQSPQWPKAAKARWDLFAANADLNAVSKELDDLIATYPKELVLYLIRGDLNVRRKAPVRAGDDYVRVVKSWTQDTPLWVQTEAQCKAKAVQENRLNTNLELTCENLSLLVTGK